MRGYREKKAQAEKKKKGMIKEINVELEEEEGMDHVLENLNNVEIKMRPLSYHREGAINQYHPIAGRPTIITGQRALLVTLFIVHPICSTKHSSLCILYMRSHNYKTYCFFSCKPSE